MFQVRTDQRASLESFVADEVLGEAPDDDRVLGGAWLDRMKRGGKSRQVAAWDADELDQHDSPRAFVQVLMEIVDTPGAYKLRVEWRQAELGEGGQVVSVNTQTNVYKRAKRFEVKREQIQKTDRTNDAGAALRGLASGLAGNTDRAMDANARLAEQATRIQGEYFDRLLGLQERHLERLDEEQASIISLMDERAELMGDARVSELRLELAEVRASSDLMAQALQGAVVVLGPIAAAVTQRLATPGAAPAGTPLVPGPTPDPAPELLAELAALRTELAGLRQAEAEAETQAHPGVAQ
tara:strand:+ start:1022 stop:1912 length:891 start_codon:yes stop_codon:yes gene_type:complete